MANPNPTGKTPENVAALATQRGVLIGERPQLIGIFGPANALSALVITPLGRIKTVQRGDTLQSGQVVGIDKTGLVIQSGHSVSQMTLPPH